MTLIGCDTSNHDILDRNGGANLDWAALRRDGIRYGWHKVSDGLNFYADPTAGMALAGMRAAFADGMWGGYHVLWGNRSITAQLDWFASILDRIAAGWRDDPRFVAVWDCEPFGYNTAPSIAQVNEAGDYWLRVVGRKSGGYCPPWVYGDALNNLRYPLISSNYGTNTAAWYPRAYPGDTSPRWQATSQRQADVLQYGSSLSMGPHRTCDADAWRGDIDQLITLFGGITTMAATSPLDDANFASHFMALVFRVAALVNASDTVEGGPTQGASNELAKLVKQIAADAATAAAHVQTTGAPSQAQIDAAVLKAMQDPAVQKGIGDAVASHIHVS